jgi:hypothetical protein
LSQFSTKRTRNEGDDTGDWIDSPANEPDDDDMDDEDLEAVKEMDKDRQASDEVEIQDLAQEVDEDMQFFVATGECRLGETALLKVRSA